MKNTILMTLLVLPMLIGGIAACSVADFGIGHRDAILENLGERWCGMSGEEQTVLAESRDYSEAFQTYLDSYCSNEGTPSGPTALVSPNPAPRQAVLVLPGGVLQGHSDPPHRRLGSV